MGGDLRQMVSNLGVSNSVIFSGAVPRPVLFKDYFRLFRVVVIPIPNLKTPVNPIKLAESLAGGKPVIATDIAGIREYAGEAIMLVPPNDEEALAQAIVSLCFDDDRIMAMAGHCKELAMRFDIDEQILALIDRLFPGKFGKGPAVHLN